MGEKGKQPAKDDGPARTGGKTPRRIQWLDENENENENEARNGDAHHALDPAGEDPRAFGALAEALEKHRRATPITTPSPLGKIHYYPPISPSTKKLSITGIEEVDKSALEMDEDREENGVDTSGSDSDSSDSPLSATPPPAHACTSDIGPHNDEDEGLPMARDILRNAERQAKRIVQTHTRRLSQGERTPPHLPMTPISASHHSDGRLREADHTPPILSAISLTPESEDLDEGLVEDIEESGKGILSTLLELYEAPSSEYPSSYVSSSRSSGRTSLFSSWPSDSELSRQDDQEREDRAARGRFDDKARKRPRLPRPRATIPSLGLVPRPTQARSGAGVFGPLIAATGSLTGVAAPHHGGIQPNLKRPGYGLSRYTVDQGDVRMPSPPPPAVIHHSTSDSSIAYDRGSISTDRTLVASRPVSPSLVAPPLVDRASSRKRGWPMRNLSIDSLRSSSRRSGSSTPNMSISSNLEVNRSDKHKGKRRKRRKDEIFITKHVAQIIQREEFILKLTRAMMMFGGPSHRLQFQIQSAARVLAIHLGFLYLPDVALISFEDATTGTSHIKFIRQPSALDLGKLTSAFRLYWRVIHDKLSVADASASLDELMRRPPLYDWWKLVLIGGMCSTCICTVSFGGSFLDAVISFPLGAFLVVVQLLSVRNVLYSHVFEITITMFCSFISAALAATHRFCYSAVASSSVVLILPGFIVLTASLELVSRNLVAGAIRICYAIVYALFLGFGFTMGAQLFQIFTKTQIFGTEDYVCSASHNPDGPWYQRTPSKLWAILTVPMFSLFLSLKNGAPWNSRELPVLVAIACAGWVTNYFTGLKFPGQNDIVAAVGAFAVGIIANLYARVFSGNAFVVMITGILFQLPSGLGTGGLLSYASEQAAGSTTSYISAFRTAMKLVTVAIGLAIGLSLALVTMHPIQSRKREAGIFSL